MLIGLIVVSPIIVVSVILATLSWRANARISANLGDQVMSGASDTVAAQVREYLGDVMSVSDRYARRISAGVLPDPPGEAWERSLLDDLFTSPSVASICYGNIAGDATWLLRSHARLEVGRCEKTSAVEFAISPSSGQTIGKALREYTFDPRQRPWWSVATSSEIPRWTPVYAWFMGDSSETTIGTGYTREFHRADGSLRGVLVVDVTLSALNVFLRQMDIAKKGRVFIVDAEGKLVAASDGSVTDEIGARQKRALPAERNVGWSTGAGTCDGA